MNIAAPDGFALAGLNGSPEAAPGTNGAANGDLTRTAEAFEAIFLRQMLAAARAANFGGEEIFGGPGLEQFEKMQDEHMAKIASESGTFGFAKLIEAQLAAQLAQSGTPASTPAGNPES